MFKLKRYDLPEQTRSNMTKATSFGGKLVLEAYAHTEIRSEGANRGWVQAAQKSNLK